MNVCMQYKNLKKKKEALEIISFVSDDISIT